MDTPPVEPVLDLVEPGLDLVELRCVAVELTAPVVLLILPSVGLAFGRVGAKESVGTGVSSVGRKGTEGGLVRSSAVDRGCSRGWSGWSRRRWISGLCLLARWSAWSS